MHNLKMSLYVINVMMLHDKFHYIIYTMMPCFYPGERGQDAGGVTRDLLATYWQHTLEDWFHGECAKVPCVPVSRMCEAESTFLAAGRDRTHGLVLTRALPTEISLVFLLSACHPYATPPNDLLMSNLMDFVSHLRH